MLRLTSTSGAGREGLACYESISPPRIPTRTTSPDAGAHGARTMFGDAPDAGKRFIFRGLLRLRLAPVATDDTVAGFAIADRTAQRVRLEAESTLLRCHLVIQARGDHASLTTIMDYHRRRGRITWTLLSIVHRLLAPGLLREAAEKAIR